MSLQKANELLSPDARAIATRCDGTANRLASIQTEVETIVAKVARKPIGDLALDSSWRALGLDSLDLLEVVLECEQAFHLSIADEHARALHTPRDVVALVASSVS